MDTKIFINLFGELTSYVVSTFNLMLLWIIYFCGVQQNLHGIIKTDLSINAWTLNATIQNRMVDSFEVCYTVLHPIQFALVL